MLDLKPPRLCILLLYHISRASRLISSISARVFLYVCIHLCLSCPLHAHIGVCVSIMMRHWTSLHSDTFWSPFQHSRHLTGLFFFSPSQLNTLPFASPLQHCNLGPRQPIIATGISPLFQPNNKLYIPFLITPESIILSFIIFQNYFLMGIVVFVLGCTFFFLPSNNSLSDTVGLA